MNKYLKKNGTDSKSTRVNQTQPPKYTLTN